MNEVRAIIAEALAPLGGFATVAVGFVAEYAMRAEIEGDHCAYLRREWDKIRAPERYAAKRGDLRMLLWTSQWDAFGRALARVTCAIPPSKLCETLAKRGYLGLLRMVCGLPGMRPFADCVCEVAASRGQLQVLRWALTARLVCGANAVARAARGGHLATLRALLESGAVRDGSVSVPHAYLVRYSFIHAVMGGHTEVLQWARANGHEWQGGEYDRAAEHGQLASLQWLQAAGCPRKGDSVVHYHAAKAGDLAILRWAHENEFPFRGDECLAAATNGQLAALQWLRARGCPWDESVQNAAAEGGHFGVLRWAHDNGCPWDGRCCEIAVAKHRPAVLRWVLAHGCPATVACSWVLQGPAWFDLFRCIHLHGCALGRLGDPGCCLTWFRYLARNYVMGMLTKGLSGSAPVEAHEQDETDDAIWTQTCDWLEHGLTLPATVEGWDALEVQLRSFEQMRQAVPALPREAPF